MANEEVIELSIEETQALRAKLGLAPLRFDDDENTTKPHEHVPPPTSETNEEELSLSIEETNALRSKLGLAPLQIDSATNGGGGGGTNSSQEAIIHAPPPTDPQTLREAADRIQTAKDKRLLEDKFAKWKEEEKRDGEGESALDFANKMRSGGAASTKGSGATDGEMKKTRKRKKKIKTISSLSIPTEEEEEEQHPQSNSYTSSDLTGLKVAHDASAFQTGQTTILTLSDQQILNVDSNNKSMALSQTKEELTNVNMMDDTNALENLRRKREIELGAGRAGGYAGFDDGEFEEFGGVDGGLMGPTSTSTTLGGGGKGGKSKGFALGQDGKALIDTQTTKNDLFSSLAGNAITLESRHGKTIASDFITADELNENTAEQAEKEKKRQMKLLEKMRKKDKKRVKKEKKNKRSTLEESDEEDGGLGDSTGVSGGSLLESLEATAVKQEMRKKRRRDGGVIDTDDVTNSEAAPDGEPSDEQLLKEKRSKFDRIMEKGKARTDRAFQSSAPSNNEKSVAMDAPDEEDDAFLNAALAKARRIQRLKELNGGSAQSKVKTEKGEEAVLKAMEDMKKVEATVVPSNAVSSGGITFENDEMQEFTRALRARADQVKRAPEKSRGVTVVASTKKKESVNIKEEDDEVVEDVDMEELANEMQENEDDNTEEQGGFDATAGTAPIGRGMSNFLSFLKQTGEIKQHATREEMRGRAKDKRTYEDYDHLNLEQVVKINTNNAQQKDIELANREIKLEYRDEHGRLLTRKEAYREMCYQFHGHGASKKNQERKLKQIEREREEAQLASRQGKVGTLGALKATQKATGKAFIIHKT